ncbi:MAG TPA: 16S rRNA (adenine(1518)-N(6)/adenine(1519)-N(6))-dimethyltransferase, partial [Brevibacterium sp.]|nr:16S rRNA (adenine(1518)-N(6)/adenine(1519)-N(6))-dimethyltransferase [Brevibacterium sp.]
AGIDPKTRGEALTVADFERLAAVDGEASAQGPPAEDPSQ